MTDEFYSGKVLTSLKRKKYRGVVLTCNMSSASFCLLIAVVVTERFNSSPEFVNATAVCEIDGVLPQILGKCPSKSSANYYKKLFKKLMRIA